MTDWSSTKARRLLIRHYIYNGTYISDEVRRNRDRAKQRSFAGRFALRLREFGSRYWLAKASGFRSQPSSNTHVKYFLRAARF